jgi:hypothetical protein
MADDLTFYLCTPEELDGIDDDFTDLLRLMSVKVEMAHGQGTVPQLGFKEAGVRKIFRRCLTKADPCVEKQVFRYLYGGHVQGWSQRELLGKWLYALSVSSLVQAVFKWLL